MSQLDVQLLSLPGVGEEGDHLALPGGLFHVEFVLGSRNDGLLDGLWQDVPLLAVFDDAPVYPVITFPLQCDNNITSVNFLFVNP